MSATAEAFRPEMLSTHPYRSTDYGDVPTMAGSVLERVAWESEGASSRFTCPETTVLYGLFPWSPHAPTELVHDREQPQEPSAEDKVHARLLSYLELSPDWDGRGGVPPSFDAVLDTISFLEARPGDVALPSPQIASDGEVGLYWHTGQVHAEVGFYGDGDLSYYARYTPAEGVPVECGRDGYGLDTGCWPDDLVLILNKLDP